MNHLLKFFLFIIIFIAKAWADDATEAAATSNIVFEKTPEIIMQDETLTIHKQAGKNKFSIDVDFHFKNTSNHDITRKIAFVLPPVRCDLDSNSMWGGLDLNTDYNGLKDFTTTVDGKSIAFTTRSEAMLGQHTITNLLTSLNVPLNPCQIHSTSSGEPDPKYGVVLQKNNLLTENNEPAWTEQIYFEWTQTFPANKIVHIQHHYTPVPGMAVPASRTIKDLNDWFTESTQKYKPLWNRDPTTLANTNPNIVYKKKDIYNDNLLRLCVIPQWISYHLTTGATWNGGIRFFKLIIKNDGGGPFAVNKFYQDDSQVQKNISANTMTFILKNFIPKEDLLVLFVGIPNQESLKSCGI